MGLRVFQRVNQRKIRRYLFWCRWWQENIRVLAAHKRGGGRTRERGERDDARSKWSRCVEVEGQGSAQGDDRSSGVDGDAGEERKVFAAVSKSS